jgi:inorganic pyrophosphatase
MNVSVMIEIPKGSRNKYEYDEVNKVFKLDRVLFSPVHYPADYGFIPQTLAEDGDPLDVLVLMWEPTFPGCVIEVKPIGVLEMSDEKGEDQKILSAPLADPRWNEVNDINDVPAHILKEIDHFFSIYKMLEEKTSIVKGWRDKKAAIELIKKSKARYSK